MRPSSPPGSPADASSRPTVVISALLFLITVAVFWPAQWGAFVEWDDDINIYANPLIVGHERDAASRIWTEPYRGLYVPVVYSAWSAIAHFAVAGEGAVLAPRPFHLANVLVHGLGVVLVFLIVRRLSRNDLAAAGGALLFGLHPLQVEPVAWATGMKDVLFGFFALAALQSYLVFAQGSDRRPRARGTAYSAATLLFVAALLAKPTAVVVPLIALILDVWMVGRAPSRVLRSTLPWVALASIRVAVTLGVQQSSEATFTTPPLLRPFVAGDALFFYLGKLFVPLGLGPLYERSPEWLLDRTWAYVVWVVPAGLALVAWWKRRSHPWVFTSIAVFFVGFAPVSGAIPFLYQEYSTVADRYAYLPMLGAALFLAGLLRGGNAGRYGVAVAGLALLGVLSVRQTAHWSDSQSLFDRMLQVHPSCAVAHNNLGKLALDGGDLEGAREHLEEAIRIRPSYPAARLNLALLLIRTGSLDTAEEHLLEALSTLPNYPEAHFNLGFIEQERGRRRAAIARYTTTLELDGEHVPARVNLSRLLAEGGDRETAIRLLEEALRIAPAFAEAHANLGVLLTQAGRSREAVPHLREALRLRPDFTFLEAFLRRAEAP